MFVINRKGQKEPIRYDNITDRNVELCKDLPDVNPERLSQLVIQSLKNGMTTSEIDILSAETAFYLSTYEPQYDKLAARIAVRNLHKSTKTNFSDVIEQLRGCINPKTGRPSNIINNTFYNFVMKHKDTLNSAIDYTRDNNYGYFGFKTLEKSYLLKVEGKVVERPQHMLMRVAVAIHCGKNGVIESLEKVLHSYDLMSKGLFTHASPTIFNAGSDREQLSSCFLLSMDDNLEHIYKTNLRSALISKHAGGIGIDISNVRAKGSPIHSTNGYSDGIVPMIQTFNATARYCNQCLTPDSKVLTKRGSIEISKIQKGDIALTFNLETGCQEANHVVDIFINEVNENILAITTESGQTLRVTKVHQIFTLRNGKISEISAEDLVINDSLIMPTQEGFYQNKITDIQTIKYEGKVYDLSIINNNNYTIEGFGLVHNSGKRKGSIAMYLQPWHADIFDFIVLRYNTPPDELRARDIFLALWVPDIFMKRVESDGVWSLFCPSVVPQLTETYGEEFEAIYEAAEREGKFTRQVKARELWEEVLHAQTETGLPYITYKDAANKKSNQKNIGIIRSSNLCNEILEYTDGESIAVCNLASIALPRFMNGGKFDFKLLGEVTEQIVENLNNIIDTNYYPVDVAKNNNFAYRPIGIGIQGLADLFAINKAPWGSELATKLNRLVQEVIYYHSLKKSAELAQRDGSYSRFEGSPANQGILQYDMWGVSPLTQKEDCEINLDWSSLKEQVKKGLRNSLLIALMPTASTAQILGNNESIEPFTSNIYSRSVLAGNFTIVNPHLYKDLKELGLWTKPVVDKIIENDGSVQTINELPQWVKDVYKTVWEIPQRILIDYSADRGAFVCQTQSLNIFMAHPTVSKLSSMHMYGWKKGLKTGSYYIRSKPARNAVKFTLLENDKKTEKKVGKEYEKDGKKMVCTEDVCTMCSA